MSIHPEVSAVFQHKSIGYIKSNIMPCMCVFITYIAEANDQKFHGSGIVHFPPFIGRRSNTRAAGLREDKYCLNLIFAKASADSPAGALAKEGK
jgi:hypothetical protein